MLYKICFYVPLAHAEEVKNALFAKGAGKSVFTVAAHGKYWVKANLCRLPEAMLSLAKKVN